MLLTVSVHCVACTGRSAVAERHTTQKQGAIAPTDTPTDAREAAWETEPFDLGDYIRLPESDVSRSVGTHSNNGTHSINFRTGIEQWEDGVKASQRRQIWHLRCNAPSAYTKRRDVYCSLERTIIDTGNGVWNPYVFTANHYIDDGTLRLRQLDWNAGILDLTVLFDSDETAEVSIRLRRDTLIYRLISFEAAAIHRSGVGGEVTTVKYRIPEYTYAINVPIEVPGLSDAGLKAWDALFRSLPAPDQRAWASIQQLLRKRAQNLEEDLAKEAARRLPGVDLTEGEMKPETKRTMSEITEDMLGGWMIETVRASSMSAQSKNRITSYIEAQVAKKKDRIARRLRP
jgi:hypothetical protein